MATIFGCLAILVKPTTTPIVVIPIISFVIKDIIFIYRNDFSPPFNLKYILNRLWVERGYWLNLGLMAIIPVLAGTLWTYHSDRLKDRSVFTKWLTSKSLQNWNFGTWELRANWDIWSNYISAAGRYFLPVGLMVFAILGIFSVIGIVNSIEEDAKVRLFIGSVLASMIVVLAVFLNLYQHQYYYIAFSASMAILAGYGIRCFGG